MYKKKPTKQQNRLHIFVGIYGFRANIYEPK
jgi:hypothetical protein